MSERPLSAKIKEGLDYIFYEDPASVGSIDVIDVKEYEDGSTLAVLNIGKEQWYGLGTPVFVPRDYVQRGQRVEVIVRKPRENAISGVSSDLARLLTRSRIHTIFQVAIRPLAKDTYGKNLSDSVIKQMLNKNIFGDGDAYADFYNRFVSGL